MTVVRTAKYQENVVYWTSCECKKPHDGDQFCMAYFDPIRLYEMTTGFNSHGEALTPLGHLAQRILAGQLTYDSIVEAVVATLDNHCEWLISFR